jgi:hypothetical protein
MYKVRKIANNNKKEQKTLDMKNGIILVQYVSISGDISSKIILILFRM